MYEDYAVKIFHKITAFQWNYNKGFYHKRGDEKLREEWREVRETRAPGMEFDCIRKEVAQADSEEKLEILISFTLTAF